MVRRVLCSLVLVLLVPTLSFAPIMEVCKSSGRRTADATILARSGYLCGVVIETNGTNNATVTAWDNATTTGTATTDELFKMIVVGADYRGGTVFPKPVSVSKGIYVDVDGTDAAYTIYYMAQ